MTKIKIRIELTVEVDPETWDLEYGTEELRQDVKDYVLNHVQGSAASESGAIVSTTLRN